MTGHHQIMSTLFVEVFGKMIRDADLKIAVSDYQKVLYSVFRACVELERNDLCRLHSLEVHLDTPT